MVLAVMVFAVSDIKSLFKQKKEAKALFSFSDGIEKNALVRFSGRKIGSVEDVRVAQEYRDAIEVTMSVYRDTVIKQDTHASIKTLGLVGGNMSSLAARRGIAHWTPPIDQIAQDRGSNLQDVSSNIKVMTANEDEVHRDSRTFGNW